MSLKETLGNPALSGVENSGYDLKGVIRQRRLNKEEARTGGVFLKGAKGQGLNGVLKVTDQVLSELEVEHADWIGRKRQLLEGYLSPVEPPIVEKKYRAGLTATITQEFRYHRVSKEETVKLNDPEYLRGVITAYTVDFLRSLRLSKRLGINLNRALDIAQLSYLYNPTELIKLTKQFPGLQLNVVVYAASHNPTNPEAFLDRYIAVKNRLRHDSRYKDLGLDVLERVALYYSTNPEAFLDRYIANVARLTEKYPEIPISVIAYAASHSPKDPEARIKKLKAGEISTQIPESGGGNVPFSEGRPDTPSYGEIIRGYRLSLGLTQGEFAIISGLSQGYLSELENGYLKQDKDVFGFKAFLSLARVFGTGIRFLDGVEEKEVFPVYPLNELRLLFEDPNIQEVQRDVISAFETYISSSGLIAEHPGLSYLDLDPIFLTDQEYLNKRIEDKRLAARKSQGQLAWESAISQGYLSQIESGEVKNPSIRSVRGIARGLNCTVEDLLGLERVKLSKGLEVIDHFLRSKGIRPGLKRPLIRILEHLIQIRKTGTIPNLSIEISGKPSEIKFLSGLSLAYSQSISSERGLRLPAVGEASDS